MTIPFRNILLQCLVPLLIGSMVYIILRPEHFLSVEGLEWSVPIEEFPVWVRFQLADGLWMFAFYSAMKVMWNENIFDLLLWTERIVLLTVILEFAQYLEFITGTFDWNDLVAYFLAILASQILSYSEPLKRKNLSL